MLAICDGPPCLVSLQHILYVENREPSPQPCAISCVYLQFNHCFHITLERIVSSRRLLAAAAAWERVASAWKQPKRPQSVCRTLIVTYDVPVRSRLYHHSLARRLCTRCTLLCAAGYKQHFKPQCYECLR